MSIPIKLPVFSYVNLLVGKKALPNVLLSDAVPDDEIWMIDLDELDQPRIAGKIVNVKVSPRSAQGQSQMGPLGRALGSLDDTPNSEK